MSPAARGRRGFSLLELMVVVALIAIGTAITSLALRDRSQSHLEEEGVRLAALLEAARAQSRIAGTDVRWEPVVGTSASGDNGFRFTGLPEKAAAALPQRWLDPEIQARVVNAPALLLGPEPLLPRQRVVLSLGDHELGVSTDGLGPFAVDEIAAEAAPAR